MGVEAILAIVPSAPDAPGRTCMGAIPWLDAAGAAMWVLVERYTGHVGYERGVKANGLGRDPPVIDCSGWAALLLSSGMAAANQRAARPIFGEADMAAVNTWSDRLIENLERRSGVILTGDRVTADALPPYATIGLRRGGGAWARNHPRPRSITHVVQIVRRPGDHAPYVSEAQGISRPHGLRLMPLADWIALTRGDLRTDAAWAVDPFSISR